MRDAGHQLRFDTLDGLRGAAAILVLFYHLGPSAPITAPGGYLAVDLFFALSGFVLSLAYEHRLRDGLRLSEFILLRLVRVYPMALVGAGVGVLLSARFFPSLLLLPDIGGAGALYPANVPLWSLALELVVNVPFAIVALRVEWRGLALILAASGSVVVVGASVYGLGQLGPFWNTLGYGVARTVFSFALGVGMRRIHARFAIRRRQTRLAWLLPLALMLLLMVRPSGMTWELACVFVLLPALLWLGTVWEAPDTRWFGVLGALSYPLYCIHGVIIQTWNGVGTSPPYLWIFLIGAAWWLNSRIDQPLRQWLLRQWAVARQGLLRTT